MNDRETSAKLAQYRSQIAELRAKIRETQAAAEPEEVRDYEFATTGKTVLLSELFADKDDLFVIHNMGSKCPYCTLWADGYNGIYHPRTAPASSSRAPIRPRCSSALPRAVAGGFPW